MSRNNCGMGDAFLLTDDEEDPSSHEATTSTRKPYKRRPYSWTRALKVFASIVVCIIIFLLGRATHGDVLPLPAERQQDLPARIPPPIITTTPAVLKNVTLTPLGPACPHDNWRQAKAQGCVYDLMLSSWLHPSCYQGDMYAQYREWMAWRNVTFWREREMVREVSYEEAETGERDDFLYAQGIQHHLHCSYVWERQRYAEEREPKVLDTYSRNKSHVDHCVFFNAVPFGWEIVAPNVTKIYQPYDVECLVDST